MMTTTPTGQYEATPRSAFSLTPGEGLVAFVAGASAWLSLPLIPSGYGGIWSLRFPLSDILALAVCNLLAVSALCLWHYVRREETRDVSRLGYAAFAFPVLQTLFVSFLLMLNKYAGELPRFFIAACAVVLMLGCFVASGYVFALPARRANRFGDMAVLPFYFAWCLMVHYGYPSKNVPPDLNKPRPPAATYRDKAKLRNEAIIEKLAADRRAEIGGPVGARRE